MTSFQSYFLTRIAGGLALSACLITRIAGGAVDGNQNGLSDIWENIYSVPAVSPLADPDGDGQNNLAESIAGTDPLAANSIFRVESVVESGVLILRWPSVAGRRYQIQTAEAQNPGVWQNQLDIVEGTGQEVIGVIRPLPNQNIFCRLRALPEAGSAGVAWVASLASYDCDGDGLSDFEEHFAGTDPFDAASGLRISNTQTGNVIRLNWGGVAHKRYAIETTTNLITPQWAEEAGPVTGVAGLMAVWVSPRAEKQFYRVRVSDADSDYDGVTDWEEFLTATDFGPFHYRTNFPTSTADLLARLASTNVVNVQVGRPVANVTRQSAASFQVTRSGNLAPLTIQFSVATDAVPGTDYEPLTGSVALPAGIDMVEVPIVPQLEAVLTPAKALAITLTTGTGYVVGTNATATITLVREIALSVTNFGAVGDGETDDTAAIQAAIAALEATTNYNTLYFPPGVYRLNTWTHEGDPPYSWFRLLELGSIELEGRDLFFTGAPGAVLYSTIHDLRANMIMARARFRSLTFRGLKWAKEPIALPVTQAEPNGAAGVLVMDADGRQVAAVEFRDCTFDNCHPAVEASAIGFDRRGLLTRLDFIRCGVTNRYGPNTTNSWQTYGGGQQVRLGTWVRQANYFDNYFDGGSDNDPVYNPGGRSKDGSHFGSPLELVFSNNIVRNIEAEAINQYDDPSMAATAGTFVIPPPDGTTALSQYQPAASTFRPGQLLNYRTWFHQGAQPTNVFLKVVVCDPTNRLITVTNPGLTAGVVGLSVPDWMPIYLSDFNPTKALIVGNFFENSARNGLCGITANAKAMIRGNLIVGFEHGVLNYENARTPLHPPTAGLVIDSNVILTQDSGNWPYYAKGILSYGPSELLMNNLILTPRSYRFIGITCRDDSGWVEGNTVISGLAITNGYASSSRAVGISFGYTTTNGVAAANRTRGMDVGVGPEGAYQVNPHRVIQHRSRDDALPVDPYGLLP